MASRIFNVTERQLRKPISKQVRLDVVIKEAVNEESWKEIGLAAF